MSSQQNKSSLSLEAIRLPLYELYQAIKKLDLQTGHATVDTQSYLLLIETLTKGYMLTSQGELLLLCEKLWLKPHHTSTAALNQKTLRQLFDAAMQQAANETAGPWPDPGAGMPPAKPSAGKSKRKTPKTLPPKKDKLVVPTEEDKLMSSQQGELSVSVAAVPDPGLQLSGADLPGFEDKLQGRSFLLKGTHLPVNPRRIEQSIRSYRYRLKGHGKTEVDWDKTLENVSKKGYFDNFTFRETDFFSTRWTVLIDNSPSMAAFVFYSQEVAEAISRGNANDENNIFYFKNYPTTHLYYDRLQSSSISFERFAGGEKRNLLIISDAGAARGFLNNDRVKSTANFLQRLQKHRTAWLNPMPQRRWRGT